MIILSRDLEKRMLQLIKRLEFKELYIKELDEGRVNDDIHINTGDGTHTGLADMADTDGTNVDHDPRYVTAYSATAPVTPGTPYTGQLWVESDGTGTVAQAYTVVSTSTGTYSATVATQVVLANAVSNNVTVYPPVSGSTSGDFYYVKKVDSGTGTVTIQGNGATIDGAGTQVINTQYNCIMMVSDGTNWHIIGEKVVLL